MTRERDTQAIGNHIRELLPVEVRKAKGAILYSSVHTLKKGKYYLMGTNPGGDPTEEDLKSKTIDDELGSFDWTGNAYTDENWLGNSDGSEDTKEGTALLQRRIQSLASEILGRDICEICATNLIFGRSRRICTDFLSSESFWTHADYCWPAHLYLISLVDPDILFVFGNGPESPHAFIRWRYDVPAENEDTAESGYGKWKIRRLRNVHICGRNRIVIGVPHLSYFDPMKEPAKQKLMEWVSKSPC